MSIDKIWSQRLKLHTHKRTFSDLVFHCSHLWVITKPFLFQSPEVIRENTMSAHSLSSLILREALQAFYKLLYKNKQSYPALLNESFPTLSINASLKAPNICCTFFFPLLLLNVNILSYGTLNKWRERLHLAQLGNVKSSWFISFNRERKVLLFQLSRGPQSPSS